MLLALQPHILVYLSSISKLCHCYYSHVISCDHEQQGWGEGVGGANAHTQEYAFAREYIVCSYAQNHEQKALMH